MKKLLFTAIAMLVLAGSSASAVTVKNDGGPKPKPTQPTTDVITGPPYCPPSDPNGCGIFQ